MSSTALAGWAHGRQALPTDCPASAAAAVVPLLPGEHLSRSTAARSPPDDHQAPHPARPAGPDSPDPLLLAEMRAESRAVAEMMPVSLDEVRLVRGIVFDGLLSLATC